MSDFSFKTIKDFDKHINASVPNYNHIHELILSMSSYFIRTDCSVNDLGCSSGLLINNLDKYHSDKSISYNGYEMEEHIVNKKYFGENKNLILGDALALPLEKNNLTFCIFLLQFLPMSKRCLLLRKIYESLEEGGALIITEKTYEEVGMMQDIFTFSYYDLKLKSFTSEEILSKQKVLRKIQKPLTIKRNEEMFSNAGFKINRFYQSLNFCGWICLK